MPEAYLQYRIDGLQALTARLSPARLGDALLIGMKQVAIHAEGEIKEVTPVNKDETPGQHRGRLAAAWTSRVENRGGDVVGIVGNNVFYGPYVNYGTGEYVGRGRIFPKQAKMLRWYAGGQPVFRRSIRGQPGQHFAEKGLAKASPQFAEILSRVITSEIEKG